MKWGWLGRSRPASIVDVPFNDAVALEKWVIDHTDSGEVTPLILGSLLIKNGFVEDGDLPTTTSTRRIVYIPAGAQQHPGLADFMVNVYNTETVPPVNVRAALSALGLLRAWRVRHP